MGVGIEVWRGRIGIFYYAGHKCMPSSGSTCYVFASCNWLRPLCLIVMLLAIGCVEQNPGPRNDEIMQRLDDLARDFREMRTALTTKLDDAMCNVNDRMNAYDKQLIDFQARLDSVDRILATHATDMADARAKLASAPPIIATPSTTGNTSVSPISINEVVREIDLRSTKKSNIVISGLKTSTNDCTAITELIHNELHISVTVAKCCRLGKPGTRPQLVLATLSDDAQAADVLRSAKLLRDSTDVYVHDNVYINADLTHQQRTALFKARMELKRRRAAGETDLIIRDGCVVKKSAHRVTPYAIAGTAPAALGATHGTTHRATP